MSDLKRVNIKLPLEIHEWFKMRSDKTGVSMSSLMYLALEQHVQQQQLMPYIPELMEQKRKQENEK
jgi:hypothetical protein